LATARRLNDAGSSVVVLEARDRVGGRAHTETLPDGTTIDHGGAWLGPGQDAAYGLAAEVGVAAADGLMDSVAVTRLSDAASRAVRWFRSR
jgi:monoamine oxidase